MATFVLVHGAWHGGWCWQRVTPLLRAAGHEVYTPTMTGLGEREHLASPEVGLETHVTDVVKVFEFEDLRDVVLVGHSYGGMVVGGVADRVAERIAHLVVLDGFVPRDGDSANKVVTAVLNVESRGLPVEGFSFPVPATNFDVDDPEDVAWLRSKMRPQPVRTFDDTLRISMPVEKRAFSRTYVYPRETTGMPWFAATAAKLRGDPAWRVVEMPTGHDVMVTMPRELTDILLEVAR